MERETKYFDACASMEILGASVSQYQLKSEEPGRKIVCGEGSGDSFLGATFVILRGPLRGAEGEEGVSVSSGEALEGVRECGRVIRRLVLVVLRVRVCWDRRRDCWRGMA